VVVVTQLVKQPHLPHTGGRRRPFKPVPPRELRHSFVSLMSNAGVPLEDIARLVGHRNATVTELVTEGTETMNRLFKGTDDAPKRIPLSSSLSSSGP
jgi:integrase